jgi:hypothetical protein
MRWPGLRKAETRPSENAIETMRLLSEYDQGEGDPSRASRAL